MRADPQVLVRALKCTANSFLLALAGFVNPLVAAPGFLTVFGGIAERAGNLDITLDYPIDWRYE